MARTRGPRRGRDVLRESAEDPERVTYVELFFDLVFAFAITQIAGVLTEHPTLLTVLEAAVVTLAIWWVWVYTTWATNWLNPEARAVMWLLLLLTGTGLVVSESIPAAFEQRRYVFVGAYLLYALFRTTGVIVGVRQHSRVIAGGQYRILTWTAAAAVFWISGCFVESEWLRLALWAAAITLEYLGPWTLFWLPALGRSSWDAWRIRGGHFSERAALFIIIVLGESILVVGAGLDRDELTVATAVAALVAFVNAVILWFLYFAHGQDRGRHFIAARESTGPVARLSYTYLHAVLVVGLVAAIHASHLVIENPDAHPTLVIAGLTTLGPAIYLVGLFSFKRSIGVAATWIPSHIVGIVLLALTFALVATDVLRIALIALAAITTGILLLVVSGDEILWRRRSPSAL